MNTRVRVPGRGWAYTGAILGGLVSIAANVAHSFIPPHGSPADWAPRARRRGRRRGLAGVPVRRGGDLRPGPVAARCQLAPAALGRACCRSRRSPAFVSYRHLSGLLAHYGEEPIIYYVGPLAVDGLMVMATGALMATSRHRTHHRHQHHRRRPCPHRPPHPPHPGGPVVPTVSPSPTVAAAAPVSPAVAVPTPAAGGASDHPTPPDPHPGGSGRRVPAPVPAPPAPVRARPRTRLPGRHRPPPTLLSPRRTLPARTCRFRPPCSPGPVRWPPSTGPSTARRSPPGSWPCGSR